MSPELIIAIATLILAAVTVWMAWETRRTAKTATKALELEQMPVLGVRDFKFDLTRAGSQPILASIRPAIEFFNAGRVAVTYKVKACELSFANHRISGPLAQRGRVLPGASITFFHPGLSLNPPFSLRAGFGWSMNTRMSWVASSARLWRR